MNSEYRIDVFPNGKGDAAICIRYGRPGDYKVLVYDGGTPKVGDEIVEHIRSQYQTEIVDDVICSHPNSDLALGICDILDSLTVKRLWMHRPWVYSAAMAGYFCRRRQTKTALAAHFESKFSVPYLLEVIAADRRVAVFEPFQGTQIGPFTVMSPHRDWYIHMAVPELADDSQSDVFLDAAAGRFIKRLRRGRRVASVHELESWEVETLQDAKEVRAEHEVSIVLYGKIGGRGILLTGNAGVTALTNCARYAESRSLLIPDGLGFVQVPNHGDPDHVSPSVLDRLIGPKRQESRTDLTAVIAASPVTRFHPDQIVANALIRRGAKVVNVTPTLNQVTFDSTADMLDEGLLVPFRAAAGRV
jgi:beta-lactamase superfamily II metal-dependent hydrolase